MRILKSENTLHRWVYSFNNDIISISDNKNLGDFVFNVKEIISCVEIEKSSILSMLKPKQ